jgi:hypothetical protein
MGHPTHSKQHAAKSAPLTCPATWPIIQKQYNSSQTQMLCTHLVAGLLLAGFQELLEPLAAIACAAYRPGAACMNMLLCFQTQPRHVAS